MKVVKFYGNYTLQWNKLYVVQYCHSPDRGSAIAAPLVYSPGKDENRLMCLCSVCDDTRVNMHLHLLIAFSNMMKMTRKAKWWVMMNQEQYTNTARSHLSCLYLMVDYKTNEEKWKINRVNIHKRSANEAMQPRCVYIEHYCHSPAKDWQCEFEHYFQLFIYVNDCSVPLFTMYIHISKHRVFAFEYIRRWLCICVSVSGA